MSGLKRFWISWWTGRKEGPWELHSPWWISGERGDEDEPNGLERSVCAAVLAEDEYVAQTIIMNAYDNKFLPNLEWRFVEQQADDWSPFSSRFPRHELRACPISSSLGQ